MNYTDFINNKFTTNKTEGFDVDFINPHLFDFQQALVRWSLKKGKSALFEDCGLGKTIQELEWAHHVNLKTGKPVLILAPLAVSKQTKEEGEKFGYAVKICRDQNDITKGINITNYEKLHKFNAGEFSGIVLDESGIIKHFTGKIRNQVIDIYNRTPFKLCATATPAPNDYTELGNTCEFLDVKTRSEMLSMFFVNDTKDTGTWRLRGHASKSKFWEWLSLWSVMIQNPLDIGFDGSKFILPELNVENIIIPSKTNQYSIGIDAAKTLSERRDARFESLPERVSMAADIINKSNDIFLVWCNLNTEGEALKKAIKDSVEIKGSDTEDFKETAMIDFQKNRIKCLITKPKIAGLGINWQNCNNQIFAGLSDSFEQYYQAVRRSYRFGQKNQVNIKIITSEKEGAIVENVRRKEKDMKSMFNNMVCHMKDSMSHELSSMNGTMKTSYLSEKQMTIPKFMRC